MIDEDLKGGRMPHPLEPIEYFNLMTLPKGWRLFTDGLLEGQIHLPGRDLAAAFLINPVDGGKDPFQVIPGFGGDE